LDIDGWLHRIGLTQYAEMFRANDIDGELLRRMTNDDFKDLCVGRRGRLSSTPHESANDIADR
jgi:hypothetical protein